MGTPAFHKSLNHWTRRGRPTSCIPGFLHPLIFARPHHGPCTQGWTLTCPAGSGGGTGAVFPLSAPQIRHCPDVLHPQRGCRIPRVSGTPGYLSSARSWQATSDQGPSSVTVLVPQSCHHPMRERQTSSDSTQRHIWDNFTSDTRVQAFFTGTKKEHFFKKCFIYSCYFFFYHFIF